MTRAYCRKIRVGQDAKPARFKQWAWCSMCIYLSTEEGSAQPSKDRIYVQIPAYRDGELLVTVQDLMRMAKHPDRLRVAIAWQYGEDERHIEDELCECGKIELIKIPAVQSQAATGLEACCRVVGIVRNTHSSWIRITGSSAVGMKRSSKFFRSCGARESPSPFLPRTCHRTIRVTIRKVALQLCSGSTCSNGIKGCCSG